MRLFYTFFIMLKAFKMSLASYDTDPNEGGGNDSDTDEETKKIAKSLAPVITGIVKKEAEESQKDLKETIKALQKDIAEAKLSSKKSTDQDGLAKVGAFFKTYATCMKKQDFAEMKTMTEGTDADGGYMVPSEFHKELQRVAELSGFARKLCTIIPMGTDSKDITELTTAATAYIVGEGLAITASDPKVGRLILTARKFAVLIKSSFELIEDNMTNPEIATLFAQIAAEALSELEDNQVLNGTGTGLQMTGVYVNTSVKVTTMVATKTSFSDVTYGNLVDVKHSVKMKYKMQGKGKTKWVMSEDIFAIIEKIVDTTGQPIMKERANDPESFMLLGYPVEITEKSPGTTDDAVSTKFLVFGVWKFFWLGDRRKITSEVGYSSGDFEKDIKSQKITERIAGIIIHPEAFGVLKTAAE